MHQELVGLQVSIEKNNDDQSKENLSEIFVAPSNIVKSLAEFLATREDHEICHIKNIPVSFFECSVSVGDSKQAVSAFNCLRHYRMPLGNYKICRDLIADSKSPECNWSSDENFRLFSNWFESKQSVDSDDEE